MSSDNDARPTSFPQDIASCHAMLEGVFQSMAEKDKRIGELEDVVTALIEERFARKSERYDPDQLALFQFKKDEVGDIAEPPEEEDPAPPAKRRRNRGRRRLDANARREQKIHRLLDHQKVCPRCGAVLTIALVEGKLCWAYQPAEIFGIQHMPEKAFCNCCHEHVVVADQPPSMIEKGAADASLLSHLTTSKQGDHLPLYRYEEISLRNGWWIPRSGQAPLLHEIVEGDAGRVTTKELAAAAAQGDQDAAEAITRAAEYLGIGIANVVTVLHPEMVVLGGGAAAIGEILFDTVRKTVAQRVRMFPVNDVQIEPSILGDRAGLLGGVALAVKAGLLSQ